MADNGKKPETEKKTEDKKEETKTKENTPSSDGSDVFQEPEIDLGADMVAKQPQLDSHLAVIEEQFRRGFDERFASSQNNPKVWEDPEETMRVNKIFREVSKEMGGEWKDVFNILMKGLDQNIIDHQLAMISNNPPIIQGYKSLQIWKEIRSREFSLMRLVDALRDKEFNDLADLVIYIIDHNELPDIKDKKPSNRKKVDVNNMKTTSTGLIDNRKMLLISKKIGGKYEKLAQELGLGEEEIKEVKEMEGESHAGAFKILWSWKQTRPSFTGKEGEKSDIEELKEKMKKIGMNDVAMEMDKIV